MKLTFVLGSGGPSGGARVTVEMANELLMRGHDVRIAHRAIPMSLRNIYRRVRGYNRADWLYSCHARTQAYVELGDLHFARSEIVIAVGTHTILDVHQLQQDVLKLRYCHGLQLHLPDLMKSTWGIPMPTIVVSPMLVSPLRQLTGELPLAVIPNGIRTSQYFREDVEKIGIGTVYNTDYRKAPEHTIAIMDAAHTRWPRIPLYVFGCSRRPTSIPRRAYWRYPPLSKARELYNRSMIWIVGSRSEGFCLPILEAMACGCVVISTDHDTAGGLITNGDNGFLVQIGDISGFMQHIDLVLTDQDLRGRVVRRAIQTVQQYTWDNAVEKMEKFLLAFRDQRMTI